MKGHYFTHERKKFENLSHCVHCNLSKEIFLLTDQPCSNPAPDDLKTLSERRPIRYRRPFNINEKPKRGCQGLYCVTQMEHRHNGDGGIIYL